MTDFSVPTALCRDCGRVFFSWAQVEDCFEVHKRTKEWAAKFQARIAELMAEGKTVGRLKTVRPDGWLDRVPVAGRTRARAWDA